jgi:hypothetical protein
MAMTITNTALAERIAETLADTPSSDEVATLTADAEREVERLTRALEQARQMSLDPRAFPEFVTKARRDAAELAFAIERLTTALDALRAALQTTRSREEESRRAALHAEVTAERDAIADELREKYPALAGELVELLTRIKASNGRVEALNRSGGPWIDPVETVARGVAPNGIHFLVTGVQLPPCEREAHAHGEMLWPPQQTIRLCFPLAHCSGVQGVARRYAGLASWLRRGSGRRRMPSGRQFCDEPNFAPNNLAGGVALRRARTCERP